VFWKSFNVILHILLHLNWNWGNKWSYRVPLFCEQATSQWLYTVTMTIFPPRVEQRWQKTSEVTEQRRLIRATWAASCVLVDQSWSITSAGSECSAEWTSTATNDVLMRLRDAIATPSERGISVSKRPRYYKVTVLNDKTSDSSCISSCPVLAGKPLAVYSRTNPL